MDSGDFVSIHQLAVKASIRPEVQGNEPWEVPLSKQEREALIIDQLRVSTPKVWFTCREEEVAKELQNYLRSMEFLVAIIDGQTYLST